MAVHFSQWLWASYWPIHTHCLSSLPSGVLVVHRKHLQKATKKGNQNKHSPCNSCSIQPATNASNFSSSIPSVPTSYFISQRHQNAVISKRLINDMVLSNIQRLLNYSKRFQLLNIKICDFIMDVIKKRHQQRERKTRRIKYNLIKVLKLHLFKFEATWSLRLRPNKLPASFSHLA